MSAHFHFLPVAAADVSSVGFFIFFFYLISHQKSSGGLCYSRGVLLEPSSAS